MSADDPIARRLATGSEGVVTFGIASGADYRIVDYVAYRTGWTDARTSIRLAGPTAGKFTYLSKLSIFFVRFFPSLTVYEVGKQFEFDRPAPVSSIDPNSPGYAARYTVLRSVVLSVLSGFDK